MSTSRIPLNSPCAAAMGPFWQITLTTCYYCYGAESGSVPLYLSKLTKLGIFSHRFVSFFSWRVRKDGFLLKTIGVKTFFTGSIARSANLPVFRLLRGRF